MRDRTRRTVFKHHGYNLRSYTELMWARLMDSIGLFYLYEPHLIRLQGCSYLPDFYLPDADMYLEVKGQAATDEEKWKAEQVLEVTGRPVYLLEGMPKSDMGGFMNARVSMPGPNGWATVSLFELGQMYERVMGDRLHVIALLSVQENDMDWVRSIGEVLEEVLAGMTDRRTYEQCQEELNRRVNQERLAQRVVASRLDAGIAFWRRRAHGVSTEAAL